MTQINIGGNELLVIEVPETSWDYEVSHKYNELRYWEEVLQGTITSYQHLPPGSWLLLGRGSEISEDQWKGIVQVIEMTEVDMDLKPIAQPEYNFWTGNQHGYTATESGTKFIKSKGYEPGNVVVLIKK